MLLTIENLLNHLLKTHPEAKIEKETNQIYFMLSAHNLDFPLFIRVYEEQDVLQLLVFMPCGFKKEAINDTARFLHLLNKELDLPGFGIDEEALALFYRLSIPVFNKEINENLIEGFVQSMQGICDSLYKDLDAVATGTISFEDALKKAQIKEGS
jgi:hypothetical protein